MGKHNLSLLSHLMMSNTQEYFAMSVSDSAGSVGIVNLAKSVRSSCGGLSKKHITWAKIISNDEMKAFAQLDCVSEISLKAKAKDMGLVITMSGTRSKRASRNSYRLYFGLPTGMRKIIGQQIAEETLSAKAELHLFKFNMHKDGMFYYSRGNNNALQLYIRYREIYINWCQRLDSEAAILRQPSRRCKMWSRADEAQLVEIRCQTNPPTFRQTAAILNMCNERAGTIVDRPYTTRDCYNKWARMFPSAMDANKTIEYVKGLQKKWPGLTYRTEVEGGTNLKRPPVLIGLHVVWPWAAKIMETLSPSVFCDGTHKVTLYKYKVVMITTVDGNKHHRPLMASFITRSTADQWRKLFNIFAR